MIGKIEKTSATVTSCTYAKIYRWTSTYVSALLCQLLA